MKKIFLASVAAAISLSTLAITPPVQKTTDGNVDRLRVFSPEMNDTITVDIWTPQVYNSSPECRLPVIYMHDGQNLFDASTTWNHQSWEMDSVVTALAGAGQIEPVIIVGVHSVNSTRIADLLPQRPFDSVPDVMAALIKSPLRGDAYARFLATTLRDSVDSSYRTLTGAENTAVMGSSMGGLISVYIMCEYPEVFGKAGCLSTHWVGEVKAYEQGDERFPEAMYRYIETYLPRDDHHKIYFDRGTATIDACYDKWDDMIISLCRQAGYVDGVTLDSFVDQGASHEENSWQKRVDRPLKFLFPAQK